MNMKDLIIKSCNETMKEEILIYTHRFEKRCGWLGANQRWRREGRAATSCNFPRLVLTVWFNTF